MMHIVSSTAGVIAALALLAACAPAVREAGPRTVQPGGVGEGQRPAGAAAAALPGHSAADVAFMQGMIAHHAQAIEMTALVAERTTREDIRQLARRIELSQDDEMELMRRWLRDRGEAIPDEHAHHQHMGGSHASMPGMLSPAEMETLARSSGPAFDRHFLEAMIRHHEGALTMVDQLFGSTGGGQESEIFTFASHVASDQQLEISRMRRLYMTLP